MKSAESQVVVGLDCGSTSVKAVIIEALSREIVEVLPYRRHFNEYEKCARRILCELDLRYAIRAVNLTGSAGRALHGLWPSTSYLAEIEALALGARILNPETEAVLDGGGSEVKFFKIGPDGDIHDFAMNPECAAGAGSFLDVQAKRLHLEIDDDSNPAMHFPTLALETIRAGKTVAISGRCSVFAKSDMIHHQQKLSGIAAIVGGLHQSMAANIGATVIQHRLKRIRRNPGIPRRALPQPLHAPLPGRATGTDARAAFFPPPRIRGRRHRRGSDRNGKNFRFRRP